MSALLRWYYLRRSMNGPIIDTHSSPPLFGNGQQQQQQLQLHCRNVYVVRLLLTIINKSFCISTNCTLLLFNNDMKSFLLYTILSSFACLRASTATSIHSRDVAKQRINDDLQRRAVGAPKSSTSNPRRRLIGGNAGAGAGGNTMNAGGAAGGKKVPATPEPTTEIPSALPTVPLTQAPSFSPTTPPPSPLPTMYPSKTSAIPTVEPSSSPSDTPTVTPSLNPSDTNSISPTVTESNPPSVTFSETPTASPSSTIQAPSPSPLSVHPTTTSIEPAPLGFMDLQFSIYAPDKDLVANDVSLGKWPLLEKQLKKAISKILCQDTDFQLVNKVNEAICLSSRRRILNDIHSIIRHDLMTFIVKDQKIDSPKELNYTVWTAHYPVTSVEGDYIDKVIANNGNNLDDREVLSKSIHMMQRDGQLALSASITSGQMDTMMSDGILTSVVTMESSTFLDPADTGYTETLNPAPLHGLRVSGMIMLATTTVMTILFMRLAHRRKKEREWDEEFKTLSSGGLVTEEGLEYMLDVGRSNPSMQASKAEDDDPDDEKKIPLPGAYRNVADHQNSTPTTTDAVSPISSIHGPREMT